MDNQNQIKNGSSTLLIILVIIIVIGIIYYIFKKCHKKEYFDSNQQSPLFEQTVDEPRQLTFDPNSPGRKCYIFYFYSNNCGYCQQFHPTWDQLMSIYQNNPDVLFAKIETSDPQYESLISYFNVKRVPKIIGVTPVKNSEFTDQRVLESLQAFVDNCINEMYANA
jgi:thiol-disulfide isomerase/thioredoxin